MLALATIYSNAMPDPEIMALQVARDDDVAVALMPLVPGHVVAIGDRQVTIVDAIAPGHKFAVHDISVGSAVRRYRASIGTATQSIGVGEHVHSHNVQTALRGELTYDYVAKPVEPAEVPGDDRPGFMGYVRQDGSVGIRNEIWILPSVGCVGRLGERLARWGEGLVGDHVDGVHAFNHPFGCSQLGHDLEGTTAILASLAQNPNAGGVLIVVLGCESNQLDLILAQIPPEKLERVRTVRAQSEQDEFAAGKAALEALADLMAQDVRQSVPLSALRLGVKCGGSDAMSGLTANPLIGRMADAVTQAGGTAVLTEIPEMFGAEQLLLARAESQAVFDRLTQVVNRFKRYFLDHGEPVSENPSPGNIAGGITTLEEKSLGAVQKGGLARVVDVIDYGHIATRHGLTILEAPGNDAVSTTALAAAGVTLTLFSTGRGTPLGSPVPTMKIASNTALAAAKPGWIDFDAGMVLTDGMDAAADALLDRIVAVASGAQACNERNDERSIGIWKRGVTL